MGQTATVDEALAVVADDIAGWWRDELAGKGMPWHTWRKTPVALEDSDPVKLDWPCAPGWRLLVQRPHNFFESGWFGDDPDAGHPPGWVRQTLRSPQAWLYRADDGGVSIDPQGHGSGPPGSVCCFDLRPSTAPEGHRGADLFGRADAKGLAWQLRIMGGGESSVSLDEASTDAEIRFQVLFCALDQGFLPPAYQHLVLDALAQAFPEAVARVLACLRSENGPEGAVQDRAAAEILELAIPIQLIRRPADVRAYIDKLSKVLVRSRSSDPDASAHAAGMSRDAYYRLRRKLGIRGHARLDPEQERHLAEAIETRNRRERARAPHRAAQELLEERGFARAAARKWRQRHPIEQVLGAKPRSPVGSKRHEVLTVLRQAQAARRVVERRVRFYEAMDEAAARTGQTRLGPDNPQVLQARQTLEAVLALEGQARDLLARMDREGRRKATARGGQRSKPAPSRRTGEPATRSCLPAT